MGKLYAAHVIHDLYRFTEGKALVVTDVGQHQMWEAQYYKHDYPRKLITSGGLGTMGFALPAAIGAKFAQPGDSVWVICGDGGFQMTACRALHLRAGRHQGQRRHHQQWLPRHGAAVAGVLLRRPLRRDADAQPDFVKLAEAHALTGIRVEKRSEVEAAVRTAEATEGTVVIDFRVEQEDSVYPMVPAGADLNDMIERPQTPGKSDHNPIFETGEDE